MNRRARRAGTGLDELEALYREKLPHFRRVAAAIVGNPERACDAVQEAFGTAVRRRSSFRGAGPLEAWVWRLVVNTARDHARRRDFPAGNLVVEDTSTNGSAPLSEDVRVALALLPERQRLVLFLRYYADLDYAAIAAALEIAEGTVAATLNAAHASLRRTLQEVPR
jgi:RNA polymerase sigma-70 factor (ECF subfamily)